MIYGLVGGGWWCDLEVCVVLLILVVFFWCVWGWVLICFGGLVCVDMVVWV